MTCSWPTRSSTWAIRRSARRWAAVCWTRRSRRGRREPGEQQRGRRARTGPELPCCGAAGAVRPPGIARSLGGSRGLAADHGQSARNGQPGSLAPRPSQTQVESPGSSGAARSVRQVSCPGGGPGKWGVEGAPEPLVGTGRLSLDSRDGADLAVGLTIWRVTKCRPARRRSSPIGQVPSGKNPPRDGSEGRGVPRDSEEQGQPPAPPGPRRRPPWPGGPT